MQGSIAWLWTGRGCGQGVEQLEWPLFALGSQLGSQARSGGPIRAGTRQRTGSTAVRTVPSSRWSSSQWVQLEVRMRLPSPCPRCASRVAGA